MGKYVIDASAWIEYLIGSEKGKILDTLATESAEFYTNVLTIAEIVSVTKREGREISGLLDAVTGISRIFDIDFLFSKEAGELHAEQKEKIKNISYGDIFVMLTAKKLGAKIITKDPDFKGMKNVIFLK